MGDELRRLAYPEVESEHADVDRNSLDTVRSRHQDAGVLVNGFHYADCWVDSTQNLRGRRVHRDPDVHLPASDCRGTKDEGRIVTPRQLHWSESAPAWNPQLHPVEPEA